MPNVQATRSVYRGEQMDSALEVDVWKANPKLIRVKQRQKVFQITMTQRRSYTPDFMTPNGMFLEVKGYLRPENVKLFTAISKEYGKDFTQRVLLLFANSNTRISKTKTTYGQWAAKMGMTFAQGTTIPPHWWTLKPPADQLPTVYLGTLSNLSVRRASLLASKLQDALNLKDFEVLCPYLAEPRHAQRLFLLADEEYRLHEDVPAITGKPDRPVHLLRSDEEVFAMGVADYAIFTYSGDAETYWQIGQWMVGQVRPFVILDMSADGIKNFAFMQSRAIVIRPKMSVFEEGLVERVVRALEFVVKNKILRGWKDKA